jgi:predicted amidohydrolase
VVPAGNNQALTLLKNLASRHQCFIGGSFLVADGDQVRNRYHFVEPDGGVHVHDKDLPTMWENAFYGPADVGDDGAFSTALGGVGVAVCWELIRSQTVRRLLGRVDVVVTGTHWWTMPSNWGSVIRQALGPLGQFNRYLSENAPVEFARRLGAPVLQASHCGRFRTNFLLAPGFNGSVPYDTEYVGATQIVSGDGHILAHRQAQDGPGVVVADIALGAQRPTLPLDKRFWIPELPAFLRAYWHQQNACGKAYYVKRGRHAGLSAAASISENIK